MGTTPHLLVALMCVGGGGSPEFIGAGIFPGGAVPPPPLPLSYGPGQMVTTDTDAMFLSLTDPGAIPGITSPLGFRAICLG